MNSHLFTLLCIIVAVSSHTNEEYCSKDDTSCSEDHNKYSRGYYKLFNSKIKWKVFVLTAQELNTIGD